MQKSIAQIRVHKRRSIVLTLVSSGDKFASESDSSESSANKVVESCDF